MTGFRQYNEGGAPYGADSSIGEQIVQEAYWRKAITDAARDMYFMPLAETKDMPRNSGKTMKANVYIPLLDDRNLSDEGIDAAGNPLDASRFYIIQDGTIVGDLAGYATEGPKDGSLAGSANEALVALPPTFTTDETGNPVADQAVCQGYSNLYASSRDVGTITAKLPLLAEGAQRVNRVGITRLTVEGTIAQFGFFNEYTEESVNFDTDAELNMHVTEEMITGAVEMTEDILQKDLLGSAGTVRYTDDATSRAEIGEDEVTYNDLVRLSITLDLNRTPKHTTMITGSRMFDTATANSARFMYVASEMTPMLEAMLDYQGKKALIPVRKYEGQVPTMNGELGTIHNFRIIVNPEMQNYVGRGEPTVSGAWYDDGTDLDVFPMLVVGEDSFSTIGFMSDGKKPNSKFTIHHLRPGPESVTRENPYGNMGLMSIRWWYGFLLKRPERIAVLYTAVPFSPATPLLP